MGKMHTKKYGYSNSNWHADFDSHEYSNRNYDEIRKRNGNKFDFIQTFYCAESITNDDNEYNQGIQELSDALKDNGIIAMAFMINSEGYSAGKGQFLALPVNIDTIRKSLTHANIDVKFCERIEGESHVNPDGSMRHDVGLGFSYGTKC